VLQVCVTGGENAGSIPYSNITLQFQTGSPAIKHFGAQPIHGVVRNAETQWVDPRVKLPFVAPHAEGNR
jgi:hypothetical protein